MLQVTCRFEKLIHVDVVCFFTYFLFSFLIFYVFFSTGFSILWHRLWIWWVTLDWLAFYSLSYKFIMLTRINSSWSFLFFFNLILFFLYLVGWELSYIVCFFFYKNIFFPKVIFIIFFLNSIYLLSLPIFFIF